MAVGRVLVVCERTHAAGQMTRAKEDVLVREASLAADLLANPPAGHRHLLLQLDSILFPPSAGAAAAQATAAPAARTKAAGSNAIKPFFTRRVEFGDARRAPAAAPAAGRKPDDYFARHLQDLQDLVRSQPNL